MLKKLIILLSIFAIENNLIGAQVDFNPMSFITPATREDLAIANFDGTCPICQENESDISNLYKSNCPQMLIHTHIFHRDCILGWIKNRQPLTPSCPMCRGQMDDLNAQNDIALIEASACGDLETVRLLLYRGANINARTNIGHTALISASENGLLEIVRLLIDKGADINARDIIGRTNLMFASQNGHLEVVILLFDRGADINARNSLGFTALMHACGNGHQEIADLFNCSWSN